MAGYKELDKVRKEDDGDKLNFLNEADYFLKHYWTAETK
jgi:hypothetical protein